MPISNTDDPGSPVCPSDAKVFTTPGSCGTSNAGEVVDTVCGSCGTTNCTDCVILNTIASVDTNQCYRETGCTTSAPSTACSESFRGTTRACDGHLVVKGSPGDACLQHLHSEKPLFITTDPDYGSKLTNSPQVTVPSANGYQVTVTGDVLTDAAGNPLISSVPAFTKIWVSGVIDRGDDQLLVARATNSTKPLYLKMEGGCFTFASPDEGQLCSSLLPEKETTGRLLMVDTVADCDGEDWCVKELDLGLEDGLCVHLTAAKDANGNTAITAVAPTATEGFLRTNPDDLCSPLASDTLTDAEITQLTGFINQIFCAPTIRGDSTVEIDRLIGCITRTVDGVSTEGPGPVTLSELFEQLEALRESDPTLTDQPVEVGGSPLTDGRCYTACWDAASSTFNYLPASTETKVPFQQIAVFSDVSTTAGDNSTPYGISLAAQGIIVGSETHVTVYFQLDHRDTSSTTAQQSYSYVSVGGTVIAWAGTRDLGQAGSAAFDASDANGQAFTTFDVPISNGTISFLMGRNRQSTSASRLESFIRASIIGLKTIPV